MRQAARPWVAKFEEGRSRRKRLPDWRVADIAAPACLGPKPAIRPGRLPIPDVPAASPPAWADLGRTTSDRRRAKPFGVGARPQLARRDLRRPHRRSRSAFHTTGRSRPTATDQSTARRTGPGTRTPDKGAYRPPFKPRGAAARTVADRQSLVRDPPLLLVAEEAERTVEGGRQRFVAVQHSPSHQLDVLTGRVPSRRS